MDTPTTGTQYGRVCSLTVQGNSQALDLSELRIKFAVKGSNTGTPNTADIRVYNLSTELSNIIKQEFTEVILQAGYTGNYGIIFKGNIKQVIIGRENSTDTFIDIVAGDGDRAYNYSIINKSLAAGSSQLDQVTQVANEMKKKGVSLGYINLNSSIKLPRGKVMYGNCVNYLRNVAATNGQDFSIQSEKIQFVPLKGYLPDQAVILTNKTGIIGTPQQTNEGVNLRCLLNPLIKVGGRIKIDNASVLDVKINLNTTDPKQIRDSVPAPYSVDGVYFVLVAEHEGDTRGNPWYTNLITLYSDPTVVSGVGL